MRKFFVILILVFVVAIPFLINSCKTKSTINFEPAIKKYYATQIDSVLLHLNSLSSKANNKASINQLQNTFLQSRLAYKKIEAIAEYYFQGLTKRINGPALPDVKTEDGVVWPPHGFQVIEQLLFSTYNDSLAKTVVQEINLLKTDLLFTVANLQEQTIAPYHVQEMVQHQIIRIAAMGVTGFDAPLSQYSLQEAIASLMGLQQIVKNYAPTKNIEQLDKSINYLTQNNNFVNFNRLDFLTNYLMPLSDTVAKYTIADTQKNKPFIGGLSFLLKGKKFNADYFANYAIAGSNTSKVALGKKLFYSTILSNTQSISCASCHKPELYFTDGKAKADNFIHGGTLSRNTPTVLYAGFQNNQFYDLRSVSLEDQINEVMNNKEEFNLSSKYATKKLLNNVEYKKLFADAFGVKDSISSFYIRNAIASYVRSLSSFSSPFDEYINGNKTTLTPQQITGFNLFAGKAKCATCHFIPLFNGTVPPWYNKTESEIIGVPKTAAWKNAVIDSDSGRYRVNAFAELLYAFKTPTIRNIEKTAPYMHNGVYSTLDEVVEFYHKGGGVGLGIDLPFQTLTFDSLQLDTKEKKAIVAFMQSLTDKEYKE
jgi:cytochrome c peroxidase